MTSDVAIATATDPVDATAARLVAERLTALPVVDEDRRLVGLVSEADLLGDPLYTQDPRRTVGDVMTNAPITVEVDTTVGAARELIVERGLRLLPVVKEGILVGVVGRSDLI